MTYWKHVLGVEAEPVLQRFVLSNNFAGSSMGDNPWADFLEDAVGHGMAEETADVHLIHTDLGSDLAEGGRRSDWESISCDTC